MKNEPLLRVNHQENYTFGRRTSKFAKKTPKIAPPPENERKKKKKIQNTSNVV